ncbi:T9SS type B sorting domain-containing protein [Capnocytophaga stomatis]|uniref:T9SS type B sorting domain-containing protein n=1 Tax=Capnocytophaga stomatis TaxID=1848904 RepID=UPI001BB45E74|nr:gliding motility-associated C-terminal domain-containing protein [Capnocytophaga stomatis]
MRIFFKLFFLFVSSMIWGQGNPLATRPTPSGDCNAYYDGLIKQTKASVFSPIEAGTNAVIYLDNSRMATDVTYFAVNKTTGYWFSGNYDPEMSIVTIPVGNLAENTTFEIHAIAGGCSFKVANDVTFEVKPTTEVHLQTRVRDEYCDNSGGIYYQIIGGNNNDYNFYHKLSTQSTFQTATADRNDLQTIQGSKTYVIRAELKTNPATFYEKMVTVKDAKVPNPPGIEYTITGQPPICAVNTGRAIVNITKGVSYPFTFQITSGPVTRPEQRNNVFENLPAGNYAMYVKDACGQGRTISFKIEGQLFSIGPIGGASYINPTDECGRGLVRLQRGIKMSREHWYTDAIPYPMTVSYTLTSPNGASYAMTRTFNNRTELTTYAWYDHNQASIYFGHNLPGRQNFFGDGVQIPYESGSWVHNIQVTTACGVNNLVPLTENVKTKEDDFNQWASLNRHYDACGKTYIYATIQWFYKPAYIVLDEAPAGFDPVAAGFTKNHRFGGRYYKYGQLDHRPFVLVSHPHLLLGNYKFTYVHAGCGFEVQRQITITDLQNPAGVSNTSYFYSTYYCENQSYGIGFLETGNSGTPKKIRITSFTPAPGTSGTFAVPQEYDYDQWTVVTSGRRVLHGLPFGTYTLSALDFECQQDVVNKVVTVRPPTPDPKVRFSVVTGCKVQIQLYDAIEDNYNRKYVLQGYDEIQARWVNMINPNADPYSDILSDRKRNTTKELLHSNYRLYTRYRVIELTATTGLLAMCPKVLGEYRALSALPTLVDIVGATCGLNQYDIMVVANGGTPPFTYKILSRSVGGSLDTSFMPITNTTGKFTITETDPSASYKFAVEDVCSQETKDVEIRNFTPFVITTDRTEYCQGTSATLSAPDLSLAYTYEWFREDVPTTILSASPILQISSVQPADFTNKYKLRIAAKDPSFTLCIPAEYEVQLTGSTASAPVLTANATDVMLCASELNGKTSYDIRTNLFEAVHNDAIASGYNNGVIQEVSRMYPVSKNGHIALHSNMIPILEGRTFTFTYTVSNACGLEATKTATLTVKRNISPKDLSAAHNTFNVCDANLTNFVTFGATHFNDLTTFVKTHNAARTTDVIEFFSDQQGNTPIHQFDLVGGSKDIFYKINRTNYCSSIARVRIVKKSTYKNPDGTDDPRLVDLSYDTCANGVTIQDVRARLRQIFGRTSNPKVYLIRVIGGVETSAELPDNYALTTSEVYRYRMEEGSCPSSWRNITLNFNQTSIVTQPVLHTVCSGVQVVLTASGDSTSPPTAGKMIYKWFENTYNGTVGATLVHTQTLDRGEVSTYTSTTANVGAKYYFVEVTVDKVCNVPTYTDIVKVEVTGIVATLPTVTIPSSVECGEDVKFTFVGVPNEEVHYTVNGVPSTITLPASGVYTHTVSGATATQILQVVSVKSVSGCVTTPTTGNIYTVTVNDLAAPTTQVADAQCGINGTTATITNYNGGYTYTLTPNTATLSGNTITGMILGTSYTLEVRNGTCTVASTPFQAKVALPVPTPPAVTNQVFCTSADTVNFVATPTAGHTLRWYDTATSPTHLTATPTISRNVTTKTVVTKYVSQINAEGCESDKVPVSIIIDDTIAPTIGNLADLTISCQATDIDNQVNNWLSTTTVTDTCGAIANTTNNYAVVKPTDWCNVSGNTVMVTITATDTFGNTVTKTAFIKLITIDAVDDDFGVVQANTTTTGSILDNDTLGTASATTTNVTISNVISSHSGITIAADGKVNIGNDVPMGVHTLTYTICENVNGTPCDTATVTLTVKNINADNDDFTATAGGNTGSVLNNDKYNGAYLSSTNSVTITTIGTPPSGITLNPITGIVNVPSGTPSGNYSFNYQICSKVVPSLCDTATVTVKVENVIDAVDDDFGVQVPGTTTQTVFGGDTLSGIGVTTSTVTLSAVGALPMGITLNPNGTLTISNTAVSGTYTFTYQICENGATPTNCDTATVTITIENIDAVDDNFGVQGVGTTTRTVFENDQLNGNIPTEAMVSVTATGLPSGVTLNPNGTLTIGNTAVSGTHTFTYEICEKVNGTPCDTATVTITIENIDAVDDNFGVQGVGTTSRTVFENDQLNGNIPTEATVSVTATGLPIGVTLNPNGTLTIGNTAVSGTHTFTYQICEKVNGTPCDTAMVTVVVTEVTIPTVVTANDDSVTVTTTQSATIINVLHNDRIGTNTPTTSDVTITVSSTPTGTTVPVLDPSTGDVTVPSGTPTGTYVIVYEICTKSGTITCDTATATIEVTAVTTPTTPIVAKDDVEETVANSPVTIPVVANDENVPTVGTLNIVTQPKNGTVVIKNSGTPDDPSYDEVVYTPNRDYAGVDTFEYELCDAMGNCSIAKVTITVLNEVIPYNAISVNEDGLNDYFHIQGIEKFPNNTVRIYNRWGVKVFDAKGYDNVNNVFRAISNGRVTVKAPEKLPQGTYFYIIEYTDDNNKKHTKASWLYINK